MIGHTKVRIGILGCARVAERYAIRAFQALDNAEVVSIASRDHRKAQQWASRFGVGADESYNALLANPNIDAVYIPLPIGLHKEWVLKAAAAGKHIICEKSLADRFDSVREMVMFCSSHKVVLYENFMCDFHPQHQKVFSLSAGGKIGAPRVFRGYFGFPPFREGDFRYDKDLGGGSLNDAGAYTVFMARKIFCEEPLAASCFLSNDENRRVDMDGTALLEFSHGRSAFLAFSFHSVYQNNYSVWGERGLVRVSRAYSIPPDVKPDIELVTNDGSRELVKKIDAPPANHFELIFDDFCSTLLSGKEGAQKREGMYSRIISQAKALEAMRISSRESRRVLLTEIL